MVSAALDDRTLECLKEVASDNEYYRNMQVRLSERELDHLYGLGVTHVDNFQELICRVARFALRPRCYIRLFRSYILPFSVRCH